MSQDGYTTVSRKRKSKPSNPVDEKLKKFRDENSLTVIDKAILEFPLYEDYKSDIKTMDNSYSKKTWCPIDLPARFHYSAAILRNDAGQGLMHTMFRHYSQWKCYINQFATSLFEVPIGETVSKVDEQSDGRGKTDDEVYDILSKFMTEKYNKLEENHKKILSGLQESMFEFINNTTSDVDAYLGEAVNKKNKVQVQFQVKKKFDRSSSGSQISLRKPVDMVMSVCVSRPPNPPQKAFGKKRMRSIVTIFFETPELAKTPLGKIF